MGKCIEFQTTGSHRDFWNTAWSQCWELWVASQYTQLTPLIVGSPSRFGEVWRKVWDTLGNPVEHPTRSFRKGWSSWPPRVPFLTVSACMLPRPRSFSNRNFVRPTILSYIELNYVLFLPRQFHPCNFYSSFKPGSGFNFSVKPSLPPIFLHVRVMLAAVTNKPQMF